MTEIEQIFRPENDTFTVFVVEQRFAVGRGHEYFHSYINTINYIDSNAKIKNYLSKVLEAIEKGVAPVAKLIEWVSLGFSMVNIVEVITSLCKIFTVFEHQAAGPNVIDPIILQEDKITKKALSKLINLNKDSILQPSIIIILKDNDFERAMLLLSECPDGINIKMIRNSGEETKYKVVNCGAENIDSFISSFSEQCYSTCSKTKTELLLNSEWSNNQIVSMYAPALLKFRTSLLLDQKEEIRSDLSNLIYDLSNLQSVSDSDEKIIQSIECVAKLFRVFCNDYGGNDIVDAHKLAEKLNNNILLAQVYRYAEFLPDCSLQRKEELYQEGYSIFKNNNMEDHAIYCKNNLLVHQFYSGKVYPEEFRNLQEEAVNNVPGMVGLSHIYNNVGIAYLYCGHSETAVEFLSKGLDYARYQDRIVQNLALESNKMVAQSYSLCTIDENRIRLLMRRIFDGMGLTKLPFLTADFVLNVLSVAYRQNVRLGLELIHMFPIEDLINESFRINLMGSGERLLQMKYLADKHGNYFSLLSTCKIPKEITQPSGKKMEFILHYGFNLFEFNTWL
jgi:hypothetical protein